MKKLIFALLLLCPIFLLAEESATKTISIEKKALSSKFNSDGFNIYKNSKERIVFIEPCSINLRNVQACPDGREVLLGFWQIEYDCETHNIIHMQYTEVGSGC